jgi:hypothetical protein
MSKRIRQAARYQVNGANKRKGRIVGRGQEYDPHLHIQNVPSSGRVSRVKGSKTDRLHHCLSKLEWMFFWTLEWSLSVVDIREQYPLDVEETLAIAAMLGIRHPVNRKTKKPIPLTTDFVVTIKTAKGLIEQARTVKPIKYLSSKRVMEKFEIERVYWKRRNIDWGIVTEREINTTLADNIEKAFFYLDASKLSPLSEEIIKRIEEELTSRVIHENRPLRHIAQECEELLGLPAGTSSKVILHLLANRKWSVDMSSPIHMSKQMVFTSPPAPLLS